MVDALTASETFENCSLLVVAFRRNEDGHRLADGLLGRIAKDAVLLPGSTW